MIEKKNEELGVSFRLPDAGSVTVRKQMNYLSVAAFAFQEQFIDRLWASALTVMEDWKCELIPDPRAVDFDKETNPKITEIVWWASMEVKRFMDNLDKIPKN